jgi:NAD(P)-dependent dehydrogenase (short-subunit alcohol dehydrogenase family)
MQLYGIWTTYTSHFINIILIIMYLSLSMSKKLENRVAVITGATSGMALATAKLFVEEGAYVFVTGRSQERFDKAVKDIGKNVTGVQGDAGSLADLDRLFETVKKEKGHIDVLFASAGVGELNNPLGSITEKGFDDTFNVNVRGTLFTVQKALPLMKDGGSIILNSSIAGVKGFPGTTVTAPAKQQFVLLPELGLLSSKERSGSMSLVQV